MTTSQHPFVYSESTEAINEEAALQRRGWYTIKPVSFMFAGLLLICLFIVPVTLGKEMGVLVLRNVAISFVATMMVALLSGWFGWHLFRKSDMIANLVFCLVLLGSGIWTTGMTNHQRTKAQRVFQDTVGTHLATATSKARDLFEVGD